METPLVTIIIAVYNVEHWLEECLASVCSQNYSNLEILCINDGSTDNSQKILEKAAEKDKRIVVKFHENHGTGYTRNRGLDVAAGKYILCLDSDDKLHENFISSLVKQMENESLDMLCYDTTPFFDNNLDKEKKQKLFKHNRYNYPGLYDGRELFAKMQQQDDYFGAGCLALYRSEWLKQNHIYFTEGNLHEDEYFRFRSFIHAKRTAFTPNQGYLYRFRDGSIMSVEKSIAHIVGLYRTANLMMEECFVNRERLVNYPEFYDYALHIKHTASYFYRQNEEAISAQVHDGFERMMLEDLSNYGSRVELEAVYNSTSWKIGQKIVNPLNNIRNKVKGS